MNTLVASYDGSVASLLLLCSQLCYEQFAEQNANPHYNGDISVLPSYAKLPEGYEQILVMKSPEFDFSKGSDFVEHVCRDQHIDLSDLKHLSSLAKIRDDVFFGFIIKSASNYVLAFRGTDTFDE